MSSSDRDDKPARAPDPSTNRPALGQLQSEVITAVRGAISGVMATHSPAAELPDLDLDFSVTPAGLPALRAEPERALAIPGQPRSVPPQTLGLAALILCLVAGGIGAGVSLVWAIGASLLPTPS